MNTKIISAAVLIAVLSSCAGNNKQTETAPVVQARTPRVSVKTVARESVPQIATYSSNVQANIVNNITPQTAGRIQKLNVEIGDFVTEGQILAEMDKAQLDQAYLRLKNDEAELARVKALKEEGGISQSDYDALELAFKVSKTSYDNLLENTVLRAPVNGVVTARNYDRGDMYAMSAPVYTIQQITPVKILVAVSEMDYTKIKKGDKVTITADALPGESFQGSIVRLYPVIDPASHTFTAEVQVKNENRRLRPGMYARVTVNMGDNNSFLVPDMAVMKQQGSGVRTVFVLNEDNTVSTKVVSLGRHFDGLYEITDGLSDGDKLVVKGNSSLKDGEKVEVI